MKKVLVLCSENSCRSQMAEGYLKFYARNQAVVASAGLVKKEVHPLAVKIMEEDRIDITEGTSKSYEGFVSTRFDYLLIVCKQAKRNVPKDIRAKKKIFFDIPDPSTATGSHQEQMKVFRRSREMIKKSVLRFIGRELMEETPALS